MFLCLAVAQSVIHLYKDYDHIPLPIPDRCPSREETEADQPPILRLRRTSYLNIQSAVFRMGIMTILGPLLYAMFLRRTAWQWTFALARTIFTLPRSSNPPRFPPYVADLIGRFFTEGVQLVFLWEFANAAFTVYLTQEPLKKGAPLTNDSKDSNGSLLAGLKAKKEMPRTTAFWELQLISHRFQARRETLYKGLDRVGGSTWSQILTVCLGELHAISKRIQDFQYPAQAAPTLQNGAPVGVSSTLPKIAAPIRQDNILVPAPPPKGRYATTTNDIGSFAKSHGQNPGSHNPISPRARKLLELSRDALLSKQQQEDLSASSITYRIRSMWLDFLKSPLGPPFRATFARRAACVVFGGAPHGSTACVAVNAVTSLAKLAVCSITEDSYGRVQADVANIIRSYAAAIESIESFVAGLPVDWTDVEFVDRRVPEVEAVVAALRNGLAELLDAFAQYREDLGLSMLEVRVAREAVGARGNGK